jgi:hypothetical protein
MRRTIAMSGYHHRAAGGATVQAGIPDSAIAILTFHRGVFRVGGPYSLFPETQFASAARRTAPRITLSDSRRAPRLASSIAILPATSTHHASVSRMACVATIPTNGAKIIDLAPNATLGSPGCEVKFFATSGHPGGLNPLSARAEHS